MTIGPAFVWLCNITISFAGIAVFLRKVIVNITAPNLVKGKGKTILLKKNIFYYSKRILLNRFELD